MPVPQHILNWLYSVLTSEYHDVNRTYNDVAHTLDRFPTLSPRTDVHTFANGSSALLLHITGTLPVIFRGSSYRFPVSIWVPHAYPREPPIVYVTPTQSMSVRPGQHIDPQGQVYHPYLVNWANYWDKSSLRDFLAVLSDVFAKEPPVVARQQSQAGQDAPTHASPPPLPPAPPEKTTGSAVSAQPPSNPGVPIPPPKPPKPRSDIQAGPSNHTSGHSEGPPRPPLPPQAAPGGHRLSRYDSAPPLPSEATREAPQRPAHPEAPYHNQHVPHPPTYPSNQGYQPQQQHVPFDSAPVRHSQGMPPGWVQSMGMPQQQRPVPPPDLLDEPLEMLAKPTTVAPPIPPNPEKDALLRQLAQTLANMRQRSRQQNESTMAGLHAQRAAMMAVIPVMQSEHGQLTQLSGVLASNTGILHEALHKGDAVIEGSRSHPAPDIDELLVAPTVVSNQLYTLVAEERALGDAIFMLGRAVERGRISPAVFSKTTRSLAREWYLKKALVKKIGDGMGLAS